MTKQHETGDQAVTVGVDGDQDVGQRQLDHLFRHALKDDQVNPLYFLLQRYRSQAGEVA